MRVKRPHQEPDSTVPTVCRGKSHSTYTITSGMLSRFENQIPYQSGAQYTPPLDVTYFPVRFEEIRSIKTLSFTFLNQLAFTFGSRS